MPVELSREVADGIHFGAVSEDYALRKPAVVIPITCFENMTDAEIGHAARTVLPLVDFAQALSVADWFNCHADEKRIPSKLAQECHKKEHELLRRFAGHDQEIDKALGILKIAQGQLDNERARNLEQEAKRQHNIPTRTDRLRCDIQARYESIFISIGRRDGFHCQGCKATHALEIDHILAIANGGDNDMENLQLLCKTCNCIKSDRE